MDLIVDVSNEQEPVNLHFPGDDLFAPPLLPYRQDVILRIAGAEELRLLLVFH